MSRLDLDVLKNDIGETERATEETADGILTLLEQRKFDPAKEPPPLRPRYTLGDGNIIATPGNLQAISSATKAGKSAVVAGMAASAMRHGPDADCLGFHSTNEQNLALLWFDSEQSPDDHWHSVFRALKRAGLREPPLWFYSYCLTGLGFKRAWECVIEATRIGADKHGGVHSVLLDGVADFVADVNDAAACNDFVAELHDSAIQYDCSIAGVIHLNPGSTEKTRGHLGSQLERKAETNLRLDKEDGITMIWSAKQRRAPIAKESGICFAWGEEAAMHVSVDGKTAAPGKSAKTKADLLAHVPVDGCIAQAVLLDKCHLAGIGQRKCRVFLDELLSEGSLHVWLLKRRRTNPEKRISRLPQPVQKEIPA